jgi:hypothetical protein
MSETSTPELKNFSKALEIFNGTRCAACFNVFTPEEIDDPDAIYIEVSSWVTGPKLQSPVLRSHTGKRMHAACVRKQIDGESPDQEALPDLERT